MDREEYMRLALAEAEKAELAGKLAILALTLPVVRQLLELL